MGSEVVVSLFHPIPLDGHHQQVYFRIWTFEQLITITYQPQYKNIIRYIMSDYQYEEQYQYDEQPQAEEQDVSTKVELEYFQIEDLIRSGKTEKAISELEQLYVLCADNNIKNYKVKILNQLLTIYCKDSKTANIATTLNRITDLNKTEKYTENAVKSIITIVRASDYFKVKKELERFISEFDLEIKLKSYLFLLERALDDRDVKESTVIYKVVEEVLENIDNPSASCLLQLYSHQIKLNNLIGVVNKTKLRQIQLKLPKLESEAYMSESHISVIKLAIAQIMYQSGNYENSALYIFQAFMQKAKYGNSAFLKQILKTNALICLLIEDSNLRKKDNLNTLFNDISIPFKNETDIQKLISLIDIYDRHDLEQFSRVYEQVCFKPENKLYLTIFNKLLLKLKKEKLLLMLRSYRTIKLQFIGRRLSLKQDEVEKMIFELIIDEKIRGKINDVDPKNKYLQILPARNQFLQIQAQNLRELGKRYLKQ